jgi:hypothetical protein
MSRLTKGLPISLEGRRELHRTKALDGSSKGKGEAVCTELYRYIAYVTRQRGSFLTSPCLNLYFLLSCCLFASI